MRVSGLLGAVQNEATVCVSEVDAIPREASWIGHTLQLQLEHTSDHLTKRLALLCDSLCVIPLLCVTVNVTL